MTKKSKQLDIIDQLTGETTSLDELRAALRADLATPVPAIAIHDFVTVVWENPVIDWGPSLTRQEFRDECDINVIMATYERTGALPPINSAVAQYVDLTSMPPDYQTALAMLAEAEAAFMSLPATVRREFQNDPQQFVAFASDPENLSQMQTWGLAPPPLPETPPAAPQAPSGPSPTHVNNGVA